MTVTGGALLLKRQPSPVKPRLDVPGVLLVSSAVFCLVYGFSNAAAHSWATPSTYGFLAAGAALGAVFAVWQGRGSPPAAAAPRGARPQPGRRLHVDADRLGRAVRNLLVPDLLSAALSYSPLITGVAFLPLSGGLIAASNLATIAAMPRVGPRPVVASGMLAAAGGTGWLAQLGPFILAGTRLSLLIAPTISTGTFGVAPQDAGVAFAAVSVDQQLGPSLPNTIFASAVTSHVGIAIARSWRCGFTLLT